MRQTALSANWAAIEPVSLGPFFSSLDPQKNRSAKVLKSSTPDNPIETASQNTETSMPKKNSPAPAAKKPAKPAPKPAHKPSPKPAPTPKPSSAPTTYTLVTEPDQGLTAIYNLIATAKKSIDMTMYELTDVTVMDAFAGAAAKGITVRVILDQSGSEKATNTPAYNYLEKYKCGVHWSNPAFAVTHQKTITIDAATSAIMTLNLTPVDYAMTRDFAVITNNPADVAAIEATFNADFKNAKITAPTGENLVWSPSNSLSSLLALINGAKISLLISQEEFEETQIENALLAALVQVTLVQENLENKYNTTLTALKNAGAKIAVYTSSTGYYIHAKTVLADYGTATAKLFLGSENFTQNSLQDNRELGLIFSDAACMTGVHDAITKDFAGGTAY
jgi:phosphatidylserine/phosphatidylglycerophosphate/cardiolipin synthase-like enzyme